jgi:hypothetical protein
MRKVVGLVLLGLSGFLVAVALLALVYVPGQVTKTPLDINSNTRLTGTATYLSEPSGPVKYLSRTVADGEASDGDVVVFDTLTCLIRDIDDPPDCPGGEDPRVISLGTDRFATDRVSGVAVNDERYVGSAAERHEGLVNKFPFGVQQTSYDVWDGLLGRPVEARFDGKEDIDGLATYRFVIEVEDEPAEISSGVPGRYSTTKRLWIDQVTGAIIKQAEVQRRVLDTGGNALDLAVEFTPEQVSANVEDAKAAGGKLALVGTLPWVALSLAAVAVIAGAFLLRGGRARQRGTAEDVSFEELRTSRRG